MPEDSERQAAVVVDVSSRTYTVSFDARSPGFVLAGSEERDRRVNGWAAVLSSLAREVSVLHRVQWTCRSLPAVLAGTRDIGGVAPNGAGTTHHGNGAKPPPDAASSYVSLLETQSQATDLREIVVSVGIDARKCARAIRSAGGGDAGACTLLIREASMLRRRLAEASIDTGPLFSSVRLERFVRSGFESAARRTDVDRHDARSARPGRWPWPMGMRAEWGHVMVEDTAHATYWVSEWPRTDVGADFLGPLLLARSVPLSVSMVMEPLAPIEAARKLENARTADIADAELRRRGGFLATARRRREEEVVAQREMELADGHAPYRFSGYVTVRASSVESLEDARAQAEQAAARCGLELRLCYGDQADAFSATLPLCRGLV